MPKFDGYTFIIHSQTIKVLTKDYESGEFTLQVWNYSTKKSPNKLSGLLFYLTETSYSSSSSNDSVYSSSP